jgi:hypothetical protein
MSVPAALSSLESRGVCLQNSKDIKTFRHASFLCQSNQVIDLIQSTLGMAYFEPLDSVSGIVALKMGFLHHSDVWRCVLIPAESSLGPEYDRLDRIFL